MKKKISRIWAVGLVVAVLASLFTFATPASAGTLAWGNETLPSSTNVILGPTGVDVYDIAVAADGTTIYVAAKSDTDNSTVYKSTDGGAKWSNVSTSTTFGIAHTDFIAVAPDDSNVVVVADGTIGTAAGAVYVTTNGGATWGSLGTVTGVVAGDSDQIYDIDIAPMSADVRYVALAAREGSAPRIYYFNLHATTPQWKDAVTDFTTPLVVGGINSFRAVAFSPFFMSDQVLTAVSEEIGTPGEMRFHMLSYNQQKWNEVAGFTDYPVLVQEPDSVNKAAIALAPDYLAADDTLRVAFVGCSTDTGGAESGHIIRLNDTYTKTITSTARGVFSVDYDGTNLVAGASATNNVWRSADPLASTPTVSSARSLKRPGGEMSTTAAWAGGTVVATAMGNESAFAISNNLGMTFNDISLIDTSLDALEDVYVTADGTQVFVLSHDSSNDLSVWRKASSWARVLSKPGETGYIVRGAPDDNDVVYLAEKGGTAMYYTDNGGETKWTMRAGRYDCTDMAVESADVLYVANGVSISKSTNSGFTWGTAKNTLVVAGDVATVKSIAEDQLIVGSEEGYVSYSTDGNASWTKIVYAIQTGALCTQVTANTLDNGGFIYAASSLAGSQVSRWEIGTSAVWDNIGTPWTSTTHGVYGLDLMDGALYAISSNGTSGDVARTLSPSYIPEFVSWSKANDASAFNSEPSALMLSAGSVKIWSIDTAGARLRVLTDTLIGATVMLIAPEDGFQNALNPLTGRSVDIPFSWERVSKATTYDIDVYLDEAGTTRVNRFTKDFSADPSPVTLLGPYQPAGQMIEFAPGKTYYWRVRVTSAGPLYSPWSEMRSFSIEPSAAMVSEILSPMNGASGASRTPSFSWGPVSQTTEYRFKLADNVALASPIVDVKVRSTGYALVRELDYGKTYFWAVQPVSPVEGSWSAVSNFTVLTEADTEPAPPPVVIEKVPPPVINLPPPVINIPAPEPVPDIIIPPAPAPPAPIAPAYIWAVIIIGAVLVIAVVVLIVRTRRAV